MAIWNENGFDVKSYREKNRGHYTKFVRDFVKEYHVRVENDVITLSDYLYCIVDQPYHKTDTKQLMIGDNIWKKIR